MHNNVTRRDKNSWLHKWHVMIKSSDVYMYMWTVCVQYSLHIRSLIRTLSIM